MDRSHPLAVVTGASSGIGLELARQLADHDFDLIVAADTDAVFDAAVALERAGNEVRPVRADLATPAGVVELHEAVLSTGRPVDALLINAGIGAGGAFTTETDLEQELRLIDLNVRSTVHLAKLVLPAMVSRGEGKVLITSSVASTMPGPFMAVYNASKSFVQSFALALRNELKDSGVTVTSLMPGATETAFFKRAGTLNTKLGRSDKDDPADVARQGFEALMNGDERVVAASLRSKAQALASRLMPDRVKAQLNRKMAEPRSDQAPSSAA